jgi:hypothetical protein
MLMKTSTLLFLPASAAPALVFAGETAPVAPAPGAADATLFPIPNPTSNATFDVGADLGSTVSLDYFDRRPFEFGGKIEKVSVKLQQNAGAH